MSLLRSLSDGLRSLFRKEQVSKELDEELNGFLETAAEEKVEQGMSRKDALRAVRLEQDSLEVTGRRPRCGLGDGLTRLRIVAVSVGLSSTRRFYKDFRTLHLAIVAKNREIRKQRDHRKR
jgi:hypothetical protein